MQTFGTVQQQHLRDAFEALIKNSGQQQDMQDDGVEPSPLEIVLNAWLDAFTEQQQRSSEALQKQVEQLSNTLQTQINDKLQPEIDFKNIFETQVQTILQAQQTSTQNLQQQLEDIKQSIVNLQTKIEQVSKLQSTVDQLTKIVFEQGKLSADLDDKSTVKDNKAQKTLEELTITETELEETTVSPLTIENSQAQDSCQTYFSQLPWSCEIYPKATQKQETQTSVPHIMQLATETALKTAAKAASHTSSEETVKQEISFDTVNANEASQSQVYFQSLPWSDKSNTDDSSSVVLDDSIEEALLPETDELEDLLPESDDLMEEALLPETDELEDLLPESDDAIEEALLPETDELEELLPESDYSTEEDLLPETDELEELLPESGDAIEEDLLPETDELEELLPESNDAIEEALLPETDELEDLLPEPDDSENLSFESKAKPNITIQSCQQYFQLLPWAFKNKTEQSSEETTLTNIEEPILNETDKELFSELGDEELLSEPIEAKVQADISIQTCQQYFQLLPWAFRKKIEQTSENVESIDIEEPVFDESDDRLLSELGNEELLPEPLEAKTQADITTQNCQQYFRLLPWMGQTAVQTNEVVKEDVILEESFLDTSEFEELLPEPELEAELVPKNCQYYFQSLPWSGR